MFKGIVFALAACFIWGLIFIVPQFMEGFSCIEIALGRYLCYGSISLVILLQARSQGTCCYPWSIWRKALFFSLIISIGYYTCVVLALRYATPAVCALVLGISPIAIAFYGNWKQKECSFRSLILPSILIFIGLIFINAPQLNASDAPLEFAFGVFCSFLALTAWSWFVVANSSFLKTHPQVATSDWSTLIGVASLCWVGICGLILSIFYGDQAALYKYTVFSPELIYFLVGCATLGFLCSWVGTFLWNQVSVYLPVSLAGQLTIFETIFGLLFVYTLDQRMPPQMEFLGIAILLAAIAYGIRASIQTAPQHALS